MSYEVSDKQRGGTRYPLFIDKDNVFYIQNLSTMALSNLVRIISSINATKSNQNVFFPSYEEEYSDHSFTFFVEGVALTLIGLFGIIGTSMSIRVLLKPNVRESFSGLLTGLAFCDVFFLIFSVGLFGLPKLWPRFGTRIANGIMPVGIGIVHIWRVGSTALTVSITIERYFAIVRPLKRFVYQRLLLVGSLVFAVVYNIPRFFEIKSIKMSTGKIAIMASDLRNDPLYIQIYVFWSKFLLVELVPWFTIVILNTLIVLTIMRSVKFRRGIVTQQSQRSGEETEEGFGTGGSEILRSKILERNDVIIIRSRTSSLKNMVKKSKSLPIFNGQDTSTVDKGRRKRRRRKSMPLSLERRLSRRRCRPILESNKTLKPPTSSPPAVSLSSSSTNIGRTLIGVSVLFLFCQSFKIIPDIYEGVWCNVRRKDPGTPPSTSSCPTNTVIDVLISLSNLLMCINSAMNFVMYMLRGSKFRKAFYKTYKLNRFKKLYHSFCKRNSHSVSLDERRSISDTFVLNKYL